MKNNGISSASPTVLPAAERREDERSETDRSTAAGKTVAPQPPSPPRPNPEVVADARRRSFTGEYKQRILAELDSATQQLEDEGVEKFNQPFDSLMATLTGKRREILAGGKS